MIGRPPLVGDIGTTAALPLAGRAAVVTGGTRGIGAAVTAALVVQGVNVVVMARESARAEDLQQNLAGAAGRVVRKQGDVRDTSALRALVEEARRQFGRLDIVVSNAGGVPPLGDSEQAPSTYLLESMRLNTGPALDLIDAASADLAASPVGSVVVIGSSSQRRAKVTNPAYAASKAALGHLVRVWAHDLAPETRVNGVVPGPVRTDAFDDFARRKPDAAKALIDEIPLGRVGETDDVASAVLFFAGDSSSFVTGQLLEVDGGSVSAT